MPELVPAWPRVVELAGGGDLAARMLTLYDTPPLITGCSQAALPGPVLVRNYDFDPELFEGVVPGSALRLAARDRDERLPVGAARRDERQRARRVAGVRRPARASVRASRCR